MSTEHIARKILLIGWDAADERSNGIEIDSLLAQGKLPTLRRFMQDGVQGSLATPATVVPPMLWTSLATGKGADAHGIYGLREPTPDGETTRPTASTSRKCKAFWNILTQEGFSTNLVNWPATFPSETIKGALVSNLFVNVRQRTSQGMPRIPRGCLYPERLAEPLASLRVFPDHLSAQELLPFLPHLKTIDLVKDKRLRMIAAFLAQTASIQAAVTWLMAHEPWDVTAVYFPMLRQLKAAFMPCASLQRDGVSESDRAHYVGVVEAAYCFHDLMLKSLLDYADAETVVILVTTNVQSSPYPSARAPSPKIPMRVGLSRRSGGLVCLKGPGIKKGATFHGATLLGTTPTLLTLLGLPVGLDMPAPVWMGISKSPIKSKTLFSWDMKPGKDGRHPTEENASVMVAAALDDLVQMGYIEPPSPEARNRAQHIFRVNHMNRIESLLNEPSSGSVQIREASLLLREWLKQSNDTKGRDGYLTRLAQCHLKLKEPEAAEMALNELSETALRRPSVSLLFAEIAMRRRQPEKALRVLESLRQTAPAWPHVYLLLGRVYRLLKRFDEAEQAVLRAQSLDTTAAMPYYQLGQIYLIQGRPEQAVLQAAEAIERHPFFLRAHLLRGNALVQLGKNDEAIEDFETCERMTRGWPQLYAFLAYLYNKTGSDPAKAQAYAQKARHSRQQPFMASKP